jgi:glycosyltransferase involved in cell wall biosynthesis
MQSYPKVLIIGQTFNDNTGGGITLSNLFYGWPKDRLAVLASSKIYIVPNEACDNNRGLDRYRWPFSLFFKMKENAIGTHSIRVPPTNPYAGLFPLLSRLGITPLLHSNHLDKKTLEWISFFNPDVIYTQLADYSLIKIVSKIKRFARKPLIIHFMDDWPSDIYLGPFLNKYFRRQTINHLGQLIASASSILCICEKMAKEYSARYDRECQFLYNAPLTQPSFGKEYKVSEKKKKIGYFGRIGKGNFKTLNNLLDILTHHEDINLTIFSPDYKLLKNYNKYPNISINPANLPRSEVLKMYQSMDLLYLSVDFDPESIRFLRYSFATKVFDYFSSDVPVLLHAPKDIAMTEFFIENNCGFVVSEQSTTAIESFVLDFYNNKIEVNSTLSNAKFALSKYATFESNRSKFLQILKSVTSLAN